MVTGGQGAQDRASETPGLDTTGEPWHGWFPGLGSLWVDSQGNVEMSPEPSQPGSPTAHIADGGGQCEGSAAEDDNRADALRFGWGEPLSFVRRGFELAAGSALADPAGACLIITGSAGHTDRVLLALAVRGWSVVADGLTPTSWGSSGLVAHPRQAPVIVAGSRADQAGLSSVGTRAGSNAATVTVARYTSPAIVKAVLIVDRRKAGDVSSFEVLTGSERFKAAASLMHGGVLAPHGSPGSDPSQTSAATAELLSQHVRLARLRYARLRPTGTTFDEDLDRVLQWWADL